MDETPSQTSQEPGAPFAPESGARKKKKKDKVRDAWFTFFAGVTPGTCGCKRGFDAAVANFEQAIARDPDFALAHAGLAPIRRRPIC